MTRVPKSDERRSNGILTRARILARCRALMIGGRFRPLIKEIAGPGCHAHTVRYHFDTLASLYDEALDDATCAAIADRVIGDSKAGFLSERARLRLSLAAVHGRIAA